MTLTDKIITLAALDMPPSMIVKELDHQYARNSIEVAIAHLRREGIFPLPKLALSASARWSRTYRAGHPEKDAAYNARRRAARAAARLQAAE